MSRETVGGTKAWHVRLMSILVPEVVEEARLRRRSMRIHIG